MALNRKYAALPDLDSAPDIYETPELTDDNSTAPTGRAYSHSQSTSSSYKDFDEDEDDDETPGISRSRLHPDEARSHFSPAQIDARNVDFSDRVTAKRKSYKASTRRQVRNENGTEGYGDFSDDDDGESLERKLARLKREFEEVREEYGRRQAEQKATAKDEAEDLGPDVAALSQMIDGITVARGSSERTQGGKFAKALGTGIKANGPPQTMQGNEETSTYTVTYAPIYQQSHALAKAADFDVRLSMLERSIGLSSTDLSAKGSGETPRAIVPSLESLNRQLTLLSESTPSSLDGISRRVRTLTQEAEQLEESRKAAKAAQDALRAAGGDVTAEDGEGPEQVAKINALYGTLSTIENLAPLLPSLLDRLRSLRAIHADAATASDNLEKVEAKQSEMAGEIKKWREGLEKLEQAIENGQTVTSGNTKVMESWVKELEEKMQKL